MFDDHLLLIKYNDHFSILSFYIEEEFDKLADEDSEEAVIK